MTGLSPHLLKRLRSALLDCGPFTSDRALANVFATDSRVAAWKNRVSEAASPGERVDFFIGDFLKVRNRADQSVLVLFLQVLHDNAAEEDQCFELLSDLALEVSFALSDVLPPLARKNLWRASAVVEGQTELADLGGYAFPCVESDPSALTVSLPSGLTVQTFSEQLESLKNKEKADWLPVSFLEKGLGSARAVARVEHQGRQIGTAFLIAPNFVLTNAHVMRMISPLEQGGVRFNVGLQAEPQWRYFSHTVVQSPVDELDFALVALTTPVVGATAVSLSTEAAYTTQPANILQFPGQAGGMMQVALRYNAIVHVEATRMYYVSDTEPGSSGSPVFSDDWQVIGLHRAGIVDDAQRPVGNANQGVPIVAIEPLIREHLRG